MTATEMQLNGTEYPGATFTWESGDPAVATVADGLVTAVDSGTTMITVRSSSGNTVLVGVEVRAAPPVTDEPASLQFSLPSQFGALDSSISFIYKLRTSQGAITTKPVSLFYIGGSTETMITGQRATFTLPGVYTVYGKYNGKRLRGEQVVVIFPKITKGASFLVDTVTRVSSVVMTHYPWYFTAASVESDTIMLEVIRTQLVPQLNGKYKLFYGVSTEKADNIRVSDAAVAVPNNGTLVSVGPGRVDITASKEMVYSDPKQVTVSIEFRGIWNMISSTEGYEGQVYVLNYPAKAIHSAYEQNLFAEQDPYYSAFVPQPQTMVSKIRNTISNTDLCAAGGTVGFADYCVFSCTEAGRFRPAEIIGGMRTCDQHYGPLLYNSPAEMILKTDDGYEHTYARQDLSQRLLGKWIQLSYTEHNSDGTGFTEHNDGYYFYFHPNGYFTGEQEGYGEGTWKITDDNTHVHIKANDDVDWLFSITELSDHTLTLYAGDGEDYVRILYTK